MRELISMPEKTRAQRCVLLAFAIVLLLAAAMPSFAAYLKNVPQNLKQPNGAAIRCFASGDEYFNWLHDRNGFTIMRSPKTGYLVYAMKSGDGLAATNLVVGKSNPAAAGLRPRILPSPQKQLQIRNARLSGASIGRPKPKAMPSPTEGTINPVVIFVRFSDESDFPGNISDYDNKFNASSTGTVSMKNYFQEASYEKLDTQSHLYPETTGTNIVSYRDSQPRSYYQPYDTSNPNGYTTDEESATREQAMLKNAVDFVKSSVSSDIDLDLDKDGNIDSVVFIVRGEPGAWATLLWPHAWVMFLQDASINGKKVYNYNLQLESMLDVSVLCHELGHTLGSPDFYRYNYDAEPVAEWDLMAYNADPPQHSTAFTKWRYFNWIANIPEISTSGDYRLNDITSATGQAYKLRSPNTENEYFILEYRHKTGTYESSLPGSGLIISRVNLDADGQGNADGPPDELYIYREGGTATQDGDYKEAPFSTESGRTAFDDTTDPACFLSNGSAGGIKITNIGSVGSTITFHVNLGNDTGVSAPTFTPDGGTYDSPVDVTIACATEGAVVYYTTDGKDPTDTDTLVPEDGIVRVDRTMMLKARAWKTGLAPSPMKAAFYQITSGSNDFRNSATQVTALPFSDELATSYYTESVDDPPLGCFTDGRKGFATAWWAITLPKSTQITGSTEGSDYDTILSVYTQDAGGRLIPQWCNDDNPDDPAGADRTSRLQFYAEADVTYILEVASYYVAGGRTVLTLNGIATILPVTTATPDGGVYNTDLTVSLASSRPDASIYFTTDGTTPQRTDAFKYVVPIGITQTTILKAFSSFQDGAAFVNEPVKTILYVIDKVRPTCVASIDPDARFVSPLVFNVEFSEPVTGFDRTALVLTGGTFVTMSGSGKTYSCSVLPTGSSDVSFRVRSLAAADAAGNLNISSNTVIVKRDVELPTCTVTAPAGSNTAPLTFDIGFSEAVTGLTTADSKILVTGGTKGALTGSGASYKLTVTNPVEGPVTCRVLANAAVDVFDNGNAISNLCTTQYDTKQPTVTVTGPTSPTHTTPVTFQITFNETVSGFAADSITVTGGAKGAFSGTGSSYTIEVTPAADGPITCKVEAGAAHDIAGNLSKASTTVTVNYSDTPPTVTVVTPVLRPVSRSCNFIDFTGTTTDNIGVTSVTWASDRGESGTCTGTTEWSARVTLQPGANVITFTATDMASKTANAEFTATYVVISPEDLWRGMTMVSIPVIPDSTDPKIAIGFSENNWLSFDTARNSYFRYPDARTKFIPVESVIGRGFWATFADPITVVNGMLPDQTKPVDIDLVPGWNLIGHPFTFPVTWNLDELMVLELGQPTVSLGSAASVVAGFAWAWETAAGGGSYKLVADPRFVPGVNGTIEPWRGYWIRAYKACRLRIPANPAE